VVRSLLTYNAELLMVLLITVAAGFASSFAGTLVALIITLLIVKAEKWSLLIVFFFAILTFSDSRLGMFSFSSMVKPVLTLLLGLLALFFYSKSTGAPRLFRSFAPFILCAAYGLLYSPMLEVSAQKALSYGMIIILVPLFAFMAYKKDKLRFLENIIFFIMIVMALGLILSRVFPGEMYLVGRFRGLLGNPNGLGLFITNGFLLFQLVRQKSPSLFSLNFRRVFMTLVFISLIMSGSRQSMMVVLIFYSMSYIFKYSNWLGFISFLLLAFGFEFLIGQIPIVTKLLGLDKTLRVEDIEQIREGSGRAISWAFAWKEIQVDYFAARGLHYTTYIFQYWREEFRALNHMGNAHNSYLTVWLDTGIQGAVALFGGVIYQFIRLSKSNYTALPILCGLAFSFMYESWFAASLNPYTIVVFLIISTMYIVEDEKKNSQKIENND
jgi:hypothetical protein